MWRSFIIFVATLTQLVLGLFMDASNLISDSLYYSLVTFRVNAKFGRVVAPFSIGGRRAGKEEALASSRSTDVFQDTSSLLPVSLVDL